MDWTTMSWSFVGCRPQKSQETDEAGREERVDKEGEEGELDGPLSTVKGRYLVDMINEVGEGEQGESRISRATIRV